MKQRYYSFDIFDTCVARLCGEPRHLFDILSKKVMESMEYPDDEHLRQVFVTLRIEAGQTESTLESIYAQVSTRFPLPLSINEMMALEVATEREMLVAILPTLRLVETARRKGQVLFISDMYLASSFLKERLIELGFFKDGDKIFVSNEWDARKNDGTLYRLIHEQEGIPYRRWHHYGDNNHSDYSIPRKLGIHAHKMKYDYLPYEKKWMRIPSYQYPWSSIMAGVSRAMRLHNNGPEHQSKFVCDISAPLMVSFVLNVMRDASKKGIQRLFFCARDMHSYYLIAKQLSNHFPSLELKYLFISSEAVYNNASEALSYFKQIGLASCDIPTAIVDTNTKGGTLPFLNEMLFTNGFNTISGYYITGITQTDVSSHKKSPFHFNIYIPYAQRTGQTKSSKIIGMRILYELVFCLNYHKKAIGYESHDGLWRPLLADDTQDVLSFKDSDIRSMKKSNDKLLLDYATALEKTGLVAYCTEILNLLALPTFIDFISYPPKTYLPYLNDFQLSGTSFVGRLYKRKHSIWKRGNIIYSLPSLFTNFITCK